jgi:hypothetical protein
MRTISRLGYMAPSAAACRLKRGLVLSLGFCNGRIRIDPLRRDPGDRAGLMVVGRCELIACSVVSGEHRAKLA